MNLTEYIQYDALGLTKLIKNKQVTQSEVEQCARQALNLLNPKINVLIEEFQPAEQAKAANPDAPFAGVPFLVKDIGSTVKGKLQEVGSRIAKGHIAKNDSTLMKAFRDAGLRMIGRCSTPEFGFCIVTEPITQGIARNPWNLDRTTGGSSGANASAVASGIVPIAHANDGAGSIRIPASCCGLVGLKPSRGRVSPGPDVGEALLGLGAEFIVSRTVRDSAVLLDHVQTRSPGEPYLFERPARNYEDEIKSKPRKLKIAFSTEAWSGTPVDDEVKEGVHLTAKTLEDLGHEVEEASPTLDYDHFLETNLRVWCVPVADHIEYFAKLTNQKPSLDNLEATSLACYQYAQSLSAMELMEGINGMNTVSRSIAPFFEQYDLLLTPTLAKIPQPHGIYNANQTNMDVREWVEHMFSFSPFTSLFNMTGQPAISVPLHRSSGGLPIGMQFVGSLGDEAQLLSIVKQLEEAKPWPLVAPLIEQLM